MCWKSEGLNLGLTFSLAAPQLFWKLTKRLNYQGELVYLNAFLQGVVNIQKKLCSNVLSAVTKRRYEDLWFSRWLEVNIPYLLLTYE